MQFTRTIAAAWRTPKNLLLPEKPHLTHTQKKRRRTNFFVRPFLCKLFRLTILSTAIRIFKEMLTKLLW